MDFYPRPPRGGRPVKQLGFSYDFKFLSTPSARRATHWCQQGVWTVPISIHALREEGDNLTSGMCADGLDFYPRPPRGGRRCTAGSTVRPIRFLSTPSARRATGAVEDARGPQQISIHALREEGDQVTGFQFFFFIRFLSTPSVRRATRNVIRRATAMLFLSTPSVRRATDDALFDAPCFPISIHALHEEGNQFSGQTDTDNRYFYPRPP